MKRSNIIKTFTLKLQVLLLSVLAFTATTVYASPESVDGATTIDTNKAKELHAQGVVFFDARGKKPFMKGHIPGAINMNAKKMEESNLKSASDDKDKAIVIYCWGVNCGLAAKGTRKAVKWGWKNVHYYREGIKGWKNAGHPVE